MEWLENILNEWYVIYPTIIVFITSILLPTLIKILQATKQTKKLIELADSTINDNSATMKSTQEIYDMFIEFLERQLEQDRIQLKLEVNKKKKQALGERISQYENLLVKAKGKKTNFGIAPLSIETPVKKRKVRVKKTKKTESAE